MERIDSHQHFWRYNSAEYGWMNGLDAIQRDRLPEDLLPLLAETSFDRTVAVQARQSLAETEWLLELAGGHAFIAGVVGWVDLCSEGVTKQLERARSAPKLVGVRHVIHDEPDDDFLLRPDFQHGLAALADFDLSFDLLLFPRHLVRALRLVDRFPDQRFVLDHIGKPPIRERRLEPWAGDLKRLAQRPNVYCKISGMVTEADHRAWQPDDFLPYLDVVFEAFGPERLMVGSDWPVCTLAASYDQTLALVTRYLQQLTPRAQEDVLGRTARRFYHLAADRTEEAA